MYLNLYSRPFQRGIFMVIWICCFSLMFSSCIMFKKTTGSKEEKSFNTFTTQSAVSIDEEPKQLITNFQDMKENNQVSWIWMSPGFKVTRCRTIEISPVANYSTFTYPWAEQKITSSLQKMFGTLKTKDQGSCDVAVMSAIVDMKPQKKIISRLLPFEEDYTYIEMQLIIEDKNSKELLCKIAHGKRSENFRDAVDGMMADVEKFFLRDVLKNP